jgi:hypothetical protein
MYDNFVQHHYNYPLHLDNLPLPSGPGSRQQQHEHRQQHFGYEMATMDRRRGGGGARDDDRGIGSGGTRASMDSRRQQQLAPEIRVSAENSFGSVSARVWIGLLLTMPAGRTVS